LRLLFQHHPLNAGVSAIAVAAFGGIAACDVYLVVLELKGGKCGDCSSDLGFSGNVQGG
jgi:hypothetical protein